MKNSTAIGALLRAAGEVHDPLDILACLRAAAWLRWCDGFGATLTTEEASVIEHTKSLGEVARMIIARLSSLFPALPEDPDLRYVEDGGSSWQDEFRRQEHRKHSVRIHNPFDIGPR